MDWGFLVGFTLGSALLFGYHINFMHNVCTSGKEAYADIRSDLITMMLEFGEIEEIKRGDIDDSDSV
jgi:hypothetical protein